MEDGKELGQVDVSVEMMGWSFAAADGGVAPASVPAPPPAEVVLLLALVRVEVSRVRREKAWTVETDGWLRRDLRMWEPCFIYCCLSIDF